MSKKKVHHEEHADESWLLPYADMLTLLLALFIVMFAVSQTDKEKFDAMSKQFNIIFSGGSGFFDGKQTQFNLNNENMNSAGVDEADLSEEAKAAVSAAKASLAAKMAVEDKSMQDIKKVLEDEIKTQGFQDKIAILLTRDALEISIQEKIVFNSGDAVVHKNASAILAMIAKILSTIDNSVKIVGHTDTVPIRNQNFRSNWDLSVIRAVNIMHYLVGNTGLNPKRFTVQGNAEFSPRADNSTEAGRQQNRRVEIFIVRMHPLTDGAEKATAKTTSSSSSSASTKDKEAH